MKAIQQSAPKQSNKNSQPGKTDRNTDTPTPSNMQQGETKNDWKATTVEREEGKIKIKSTLLTMRTKHIFGT